MLDPWVKLGFGQETLRTGSYAESFVLMLRVIHDILDVVGRPQGSYTEIFVSVSIIDWNIG